MIEHYSDEACADPDRTEMAVHVSAQSFLNSIYMKRSEWFRTTPVHSFVGAAFKPRDSTPFRVSFHIEMSDPPVVTTPDETPLDDDYYVARLLAEVVIDEPDAWPQKPSA